MLNGFFELLGLTETAGDIMRTIDKLEKIGGEKVKQLLMTECGVEEDKADEIIRFISCPGTSADKLAFLETYRGRCETFDLGLDELNTVAAYLPAFGVKAENFAIDLTIARGLDYYTGTVYETTMTDYPEIGSVCSGGRYDNLAEYYTDKKLPGVGISIGLTRLFYVLGEQGLLNDEMVTAPADVLVIPMTEDLSFPISAATILREAGVRTQVYTEKKKVKQKFAYADKMGIPFAVIIGDDEAAQGLVSVKDLTSGNQELMSPAAAAEKIKAEMDVRALVPVIREK